MTIRALFADIGGVLATNGWDTDSRQAAIQRFSLDAREFESRNRLTSELFEVGKISWDEYLDQVVFHVPRAFARAEFTEFVLARSRVFPPMIDLLAALKRNYGIKMLAVSNEGRELTEYRIRKLHLDRALDTFVCSCFVRLRKPDLDIYRLALDLAQVEPGETVYLEDRELFVEAARKLGINAILHRDLNATRAALADFGLRADPEIALKAG